MLTVEPRFFDRTEGITDSELLFFLALTFGLDEDPLPAIEAQSGPAAGPRREAFHH